MMRRATLFPLALLLPLLAGCEEEVIARPDPAELDTEAQGYFCMMAIDEHPGPKAQVFLAGKAEPVWFPSVRDMLTFRLLPGETDEAVAIYVNDVGKGGSYERPAPGSWIDAEKAFYVIGSRHPGGMGLPEAVPFGSAEDAAAFAASYGGEVKKLDEISSDWVFADEMPALPGQGES